MGRPAAIYLPGPYCRNGHKRTVKNTRWRTLRMYGKYEYRTARCAICEARAQLARNSYHKKLKFRRKPKAAGQQPLQIDGGGAG